MACRMGQRDELRQKPPNARRKRPTQAPVRLTALSEDRNRAALLFDGPMRQFIAAKFNSLLTSPRFLPHPHMLGELRVLLPSAQLLSAFLITVPFSAGFAAMVSADKGVFLATFMLAITSLVMLSAPAVRHRLIRPLVDRARFKRLPPANRAGLGRAVCSADPGHATGSCGGARPCRRQHCRGNRRGIDRAAVVDSSQGHARQGAVVKSLRHAAALGHSQPLMASQAFLQAKFRRALRTAPCQYCKEPRSRTSPSRRRRSC